MKLTFSPPASSRRRRSRCHSQLECTGSTTGFADSSTAALAQSATTSGSGIFPFPTHRLQCLLRRRGECRALNTPFREFGSDPSRHWYRSDLQVSSRHLRLQRIVANPSFIACNQQMYMWVTEGDGQHIGQHRLEYRHGAGDFLRAIRDRTSLYGELDFPGDRWSDRANDPDIGDREDFARWHLSGGISYVASNAALTSIYNGAGISGRSEPSNCRRWLPSPSPRRSLCGASRHWQRPACGAGAGNSDGLHFEAGKGKPSGLPLCFQRAPQSGWQATSRACPEITPRYTPAMATITEVEKLRIGPARFPAGRPRSPPAPITSVRPRRRRRGHCGSIAP